MDAQREEATCLLCDGPLPEPDAPCPQCSRKGRRKKRERCARCGRPASGPGACECPDGLLMPGGRLARLLGPFLERPGLMLMLILSIGLAAAWHSWEPSEAADQSKRARALLGDKGTPEAADLLMRDAQEIGVPLDWLLRAQRHCVFNPKRRPGVPILRAVVKSARASGGAPERALIETTKAACRER